MNLGFVQLEVSKVKNRELVIPGAGKEQMRKLHQVLQSALFQDQIPHYRPIGAYIKGTVKHPSDMVTRVLGVNKSYIELWRDTKDLIMAEGGGFLQNGLLGDQEKNKDFGVIYTVETATTSNGGFQFCGMGKKTASMLVKNVPVVTLVEGCEVKLFLYRGTGLIDFFQAEDLLRHLILNYDASRVIPQRAVYSLYNNLVLQPYREEDEDVLRFTYKCDIDEAVLTRIIQDYARDLGGSE